MTKMTLSKAALIFSIFLLSPFIFLSQSYAAQTTGGVNWIDPLGYQKPQFYPLTVPDESTAAKYYVDLDSGSDSNSGLSPSSPCRTLNGLAGKSGSSYDALRGGPAYVYVQGNGNFSITSGNLYGSAGKEIVIKNWLSSGNMSLSGPNNVESSKAHDLIIDGGPNMLFQFNGSSGYGEGNSNGFALNLNSNYVTFYRVQFRVNGGTEGVGIARNSGNVTGSKFINCEFYDNGSMNGTAPLMYPGGGNTCGGSSTINDTYVINNIFRDAGPEAIEFNPRTLSDGVYISGNAFHNIGKVSCSTNWACRPAIILDGPSCGGQTRDAYIENNIIWDTGSGGIWDRGGSANTWIFNNTIYDYGNGSGNGGVNPQGISGYTNGGQATVRDNIIYDPQGTNPFDGSRFVASNNMCGPGESCGSNSQTYTSGTFISTDPGSPNFLKLNAGSTAVNDGYATGVTTSYFGTARDASIDIGACEYQGGGIAVNNVNAPTGLRVVP